LGYGLTDINKTEFGMDVDLTDGDDPDALRRKIMKYQPCILAFTAKRPAMVFLARKKLAYGFQDDTIGATRLYVLPSPSGRAGSFWDIETWRTLAEAVK
jgi:TDG/mug DNA glycosylase family protein